MELAARSGDRGDMIKNVILGVYATAWLFVMIITVWRTGAIPPELWLYLGIGTGTLLGIFQAENKVTQRREDRRGPDS